MNVTTSKDEDYFVIKFSDGLYLHHYGKDHWDNEGTDDIDLALICASAAIAQGIIDGRTLDAKVIRIITVKTIIEMPV